MESLDVVELGTGFIRVSFVFGRHDDGLDYIEKKVRCEVGTIWEIVRPIDR
jgi:hypothetical protein